MGKNLSNQKMLAVVCSAVLFIGTSMTTTAQQAQHKKKKNVQHAQQQVQQQKVQQKAQQQQQDRKQYDQRLTVYRQRLVHQQQLIQQSRAQLQREKRMAQSRYQQQYLAQMLEQQRRYGNAHNQNYQNDPFFQTAFDRRYNRGGTYYETNRYGLEHLQQAIQYGYAEGFQAGRADRQDRWRSDYERADAYRDANYGYNGYYVSQDDYNYYFREGFRRGYEDGYNSRYQYGSLANGRYTILDRVLAAIIPFEMLR
jgi:hypothetical protein